eukprot:scaffold102133_cov36-Tisochrysis_lutea.AAC.2
MAAAMTIMMSGSSHDISDLEVSASGCKSSGSEGEGRLGGGGGGRLGRGLGGGGGGSHHQQLIGGGGGGDLPRQNEQKAHEGMPVQKAASARGSQNESHPLCPAAGSSER